MGLLTLSHWDLGSRNCRFCGSAVNARTEAGRHNLARFGNPDNPEPALCAYFCIRHREWTEEHSTCADWRDPRDFNAATETPAEAQCRHRRC